MHNLRTDVLADEGAESQHTKQVTFEGCAAYGIIPQPTEDKSYEYEAIPLAHLPPAHHHRQVASLRIPEPCKITEQSSVAKPEAHVKMEMSTSTSRLVPQPPLMSLSLGREMTSTVVTMLMDKM